MVKVTLLMAAGISIGSLLAMILAATTTTTNLAKASTCGFSMAKHGGAFSLSSTFSGSCASGGAVGQSVGGVPATPHGDSKSSCSSVSASQFSGIHENSDSNGAVSCSSHSP